MSLDDLKEWTNSAVLKVADYSKLDASLNAKEKIQRYLEKFQMQLKNYFEIRSVKGQANEFGACNPR